MVVPKDAAGSTKVRATKVRAVKVELLMVMVRAVCCVCCCSFTLMFYWNTALEQSSELRCCAETERGLANEQDICVNRYNFDKLIVAVGPH